jgi:positive regulator of sigma E activity
LFLVSVKLKDKPIYEKLRELSSLIYYLHYLILMSSVAINESLKNSKILFLIVLFITIIVSLIIIKLNKKKIKFY